MKTIMIEAVRNGWLVRPFRPCVEWATGENERISVYTSMEDLQRDLPNLFSVPDVHETRRVPDELAK